MDDEYLTVAEVAALLKPNPQTVRNWIDHGELPASRVGRRVRILRADVDAKIGQDYTNKPEADQRQRLATASTAVAATSRGGGDEALVLALELSEAAASLASGLSGY